MTDLVASVIPMVYAQTRHALNAADLRGQMFIELMGAANRFDPQRIGPERWPTYAWMSLEHARWRGVDGSGVVRKRSRSPRPTTITMDGREPASRAPGPDEAIEERESVAAITQALGHLPPSLRDPLLESMQRRSPRAIGDNFGFSESTARRRIQAARDHVRDELASLRDDHAGDACETVTDPVLERSQRIFQQAFSPSIGPEPVRGPDR